MKKRILKRSILSLVLSVSLAVSPLANVGFVASAASETWYTQDFSEVTDASTVATSTNAQDALAIAEEGEFGNYLSYDVSSLSPRGGRGAYMDFTGLDVSAQSTYIVEFDAAIKPGNGSETGFAVKGADFKYKLDTRNKENINMGAASGYLLNLLNGGKNSTEYTLNGTESVTIPSDVWCHYKLYVDKDKRMVSTTITNSTTSAAIADKVITAYDGAGNVAGLYMLAGKVNGAGKIDNIVVRSVTEEDEFGTVAAETFSSAEFVTGLNAVITQPAEGEPIHKTLAIKANGNLGGDLTESVTVDWSVVGLEDEDGHISLTKAEGTGTGTEGEPADGTTAYFNVRNGVSDYFGYVQAIVSYGDDSYTIKTPFAVIGTTSVDENQLAPAAGYYANMNNYADSLVGYVGTANGMADKDLVLNNWTFYGSNGARTFKLVQDADGTKSLEFASNGGSGSNVAVYQWVDQTSKYAIEFTAKFTAAMTFGVYANTPNLADPNPEWTASYSGGALTLNGSEENITGINANEWYRFVITAEASTQKASVAVYNSTDVKVGEITNVDMTNADSVQKYFCFMGTWPMYLNSFKAYLVQDGEELVTVSYNMNGHGTAIDSVQVAAGSTLTAPETPSEEGYSFKGWYKEAECTTAWNFSTDTVTTDTTLYAKWQASTTPATEYYIVADATGDITAVDTAALIYSDKIIGYQVTTSKNGKLVKQTIETTAPVSVDTTGADKVEVAPVYFYDIGVAGEKGTAGYDISLPAGSYDFIVYNTSGQRCDVYANDQMLVNNILQYGSTPDHFAVKDIVIAEDNIKISTADYSSGKDANSVYIKVQVVKSPSIVDRVQKVYVLGDSLVAMYYNGCNAENNNQTGWGQVLADYLTDAVDVVDLANSGITANGLYGSAFSQIKGSAKAGDILILESGYNDKSYDTEEIMKSAVTNMVNEAEALGVTVILVSPNASAHDYKESVAWTSYMADVATAEDVKYFDLSAASYNYLFGLYGADTTVLKSDWNVSDTLHSTYKAANKWASLVAGYLYNNGFETIVDGDYVFAFGDSAGNVISCSATGKLAEGYAKVTFDMNGQGAANVYQVVKTGSKVTKPATPAASGSVFDGWYKEAECTTPWNFETDTISADTVIYAKWIQNAAGTIYTENFSNVTDASTVATSPNAQTQLKIKQDASLGNYLAYDFSDLRTNSRGAYMNFPAIDVSSQEAYIVEFDALIAPGDNQTTYFTVKGDDFKYISNNVNYGTDSGYLLNLVVEGGKKEYTLNTTQKVTIPSGEWCHYKLYVDKTQGLVSTTITGSSSGEIADKVITAYDGAGNVAGFYMLAGRYSPVIAMDNILVREVGELDEFGELQAETLSSAEFASALNTTITQPAEGTPVHKPITIKANGSLGGDLSDKVTVQWSVVGLEKEDGYISLTKAQGTGAGTAGEEPDGTTAYFNVRNGVSNYFGYVKAVVSYGEDSFTITTPFAVIGATGSDANRLAPATGYPANMNDYANSLVGYVGTSNAVNSKDVVLNNWSIYGSNGARTMKLVEVDGKKALEFASNGGGGSTVAVYQWTDQAGQYVIDFTAKFTADMEFGVYFNTPNNSGSNPEWTASYSAGAMTLGTGRISGINANEWYRVVVSADPSVQKVSLTVYDSANTKVGEITDIDMTNDTSVQKYFCFIGTWPMYLNSFEAYKPALASISAAASAEVVKVPEEGEEDSKVDLSATLTSNGGMLMTGAVEWKLAEDYANVEVVSTGAQTAELRIGAGASGSVTVVATKDGKQAEVTVLLTTSSNVVAFTRSASSITIPFNGEEAVVSTYLAETRGGNGQTIDGGAITYTLLAKDGVTETTVKGVTFANGVLTVAAGANPAVVYVKATNAEGLSTKVKVNIHGLSFKFGSAEAAEGLTQVTDTLYTAKLGYGFAKTEGLTVNAENVTASEAFRFKATVPNGNYNVKVTTSAESMLSEVVESVSAVTGITKTGTSFSVAVCDGVLDLTFPAGATVTSIEISQAAVKTALEKPMIYAIGDSTTKNNASGALSWGNCVENNMVLVPSAFNGFANHGMAGRDSVSYYNQGRVEAVLLAVCPGDYVTVNMGINSKESGEAASYYTLLSEYYVEGILQRGGVPVIVTATPDGPVGDRVAGNYDSTTGKFTNSRGDGARNDVLRQIAAEKKLNLIELGQWGQDWMNTLTKDDVAAYNAKNGTSFTTVLEMVQSWYVDHNHYKEYLGIKIADYLFGELKDLAVEKVSITEDFENETGNWGMTGDLASNVSVVEDASASNHYLLLSKSEVRDTTTTKAFADMPRMSEASISFNWYVGGQTSTYRAGMTGITFNDGEAEVLALYTGEMRAAGDSSVVSYSTSGVSGKVDSDITVKNGQWYTVTVDFDFVGKKADVTIGNSTISDIALTEIIQKVDSFSIKTIQLSDTKITINVGIDDFELKYAENTAADTAVSIYALAKIANISVNAKDWASYKHPASIEATLTNAEKINVQIDANSWTCENFDENKTGAYTWTAQIIAPEEYPNTKGLTVSYVMEYRVATAGTHDYFNDFTFASDLIPSIAWGKGMDSSSGSGYFSLSHATDSDNNGYLNATVTGNGDRGSRLDLESGIIKGAEVSFDWMPINSNGKGNGQILFVAPGKWHSYFTLRFDAQYNIVAYTENPLGMCSTSQVAFEGSIGASNPIETGLSGAGKWYTVSLSFDYLAHTADLTITDKANPENTFTKTGIPIEAEANGIRSMVIHMSKLDKGASVTMGLDNIVADYDTFGPSDVVKIVGLANVAVAKIELDEYKFPDSVNVELGDGTTTTLPVRNWTATPEFDKDTAAEYVWTAELVLGSYTNYFDLKPSFNMTYTMLPYPTYVYNPTTLQLKFGETFDGTLPTTVSALMSNGRMSSVEVGEWTAIREFNAEEEGIYVYGANIVAKDGVYDVLADKMTPNENPNDPSAQRADYIYDVYYRISYFKDADNYNGYTRSMEYLDRGVYAVASEDGVFVSWRLLVTEYGEDISFNVYRNGVQANDAPITSKTNFVDAAGKAGDTYTVAKVVGDLMYESAEVVATAENYMSIPIQKPDPQPTKNGVLSEYTANDAGVADVDGDGEYEIIVKWYPNNAFDSGAAVAPSSPTIFDVYEMDGTPLWRLNLGLEMPSGAHFNQFMLYDLDEDGKAELFIKTSDGSITYKPNAEGKFDMTDESTIVAYIGDRSVVPGTNVNANGHVNSNTNEYITVFNGQTGEVIDTIDYVNTTGEFADWGKEDGGNRSARYNIAIAYLPREAGSTETIPAVLFNRGYYAKTTIAAYTLRDGKITLEWNFVRETGDIESGKGNHNVSTGDIDKDGFDEIIIGAMAVDHDGTVLWVKDGQDGQDFAGHADTIHLAAMDPNSDDLYVFTPNEETASTVNHALVNARTGVRIGGGWFTKKDVGRAVAANITPLPGYEYWSAATNSGIYGFDGSLVSSTKPIAMNWIMYWDGDLLSELGDGIATDDDWAITKYNWETNTADTLAVLEGTRTNNSTKKTPSLTADLFGDWREEVVLRNDDDTELRIYMTTEETDYMIYTLMHDPVYRNAVANQNTSYNQPPHIGFYLGEDNADTVLAMGLPTANVKYTVEVSEEGKPVPTPAPTAAPTAAPTVAPVPTAAPTAAPTATPTVAPVPTAAPTAVPTEAPDMDEEGEEDEESATPAPSKAPAPTSEPSANRPAATAAPTATATPKPAATATPKPAATAAPKPGATETPKPGATATPKPGSTTDNTITIDLGKKDQVPASMMTDEVKKNTGCETVEQLISYMKAAIIKQFAGNNPDAPVFNEENIVVYEITVMVGGQPATKENFPKEGVDVIIPYPQGTNRADFDFVVGHMPSNDWNGAKPGVMEYPAVTKTDEGLKVHVISASPFVVSWTEIADPAQSGDTVTAKNVSTWIIVGVLAAALVGIAAAVVVQQRKKKEE